MLLKNPLIAGALIAKNLDEIPETMSVKNSVSGCCCLDEVPETMDCGGGLVVGESLDEVPETVSLKNPISGCCRLDGIPKTMDCGGVLVAAGKSRDEIPETMDCGGVVVAGKTRDEIPETVSLKNPSSGCWVDGLPETVDCGVVVAAGKSRDEIPETMDCGGVVVAGKIRDEIPETVSLKNPSSGCWVDGIPETMDCGGVMVAAGKSRDEVPETMDCTTDMSSAGEILESGLDDIGGIRGRDSEIDGADYVDKTLNECNQDGVAVIEGKKEDRGEFDGVELGKTVGEFNQDGVAVVEDVELGKTEIIEDGVAVIEGVGEEGGGKFGDDVELGKTLIQDGVAVIEGEGGKFEDGVELGKTIDECKGEGKGEVEDGSTSEEEEDDDDDDDDDDERVYRFGGRFGPLREDFRKQSDYYSGVYGREQFPNECDCGRCRVGRDDWYDEDGMVMMGNHQNPYLFRNPMNPYSQMVIRNEKLHLLKMKKDRRYRMNYMKMIAREKSEAEKPFFYGSHFMNRRNERESRWDLNQNRSFELPEPEQFPVGAGLSNLGNTCFLNAIIQCFTHTVPFVEGLQLLKHTASSHGQDEFCVLCAVRQQIELSLKLSGKVVPPSNLVDNLSHISSDFRKFQQEDAHEFLLCLLDKLDSNWCKHEADAGDSLVKQVFGGRLVSQLRCCECGHNSDSYEDLNHLSLEIEEGVDDLENAFKSFTKVENLQEKYRCGGCNEMVLGEKQLLIDQAPPVAAVHLKRFKSDGFRMEKIDRKVDYPLEFDLNPYTKGTRIDDHEGVQYELYGFVVHLVLVNNIGHYICYIRTSPDTWYRFDDSKVAKVSELHALNQEAYILFYARKGTPWFSDSLDKWKTVLEEKSNVSPNSVLDPTNLPSTSSVLAVFNDSSEVTNADPLDWLNPETDEEHSLKSSTQVLGGPTKKSFNDETETRIELKTRSFADFDDMDVNPIVSLEPSISNLQPSTSNLQAAAEQMISSSPVESKAATCLTVKKKARKDGSSKYVKSSCIPLGRRQMLMAVWNEQRNSPKNKKKRKQSAFLHKQSHKRRVKNIHCRRQ